MKDESLQAGGQVMNSRKKLGEILVEKGVLTVKTVERMLVLSNHHNKRLGMALEDMGLVTGEELADALAEQFSLPVISGMDKFRIAPELLQLITPELATQHLMIPLRIFDGALHLALADPTSMKIANNLAANNDLKLAPFVASRKDIHKAICRHYLGIEDEEPTQRTILIVEDDFFIQKTLSDVLVREGYRILAAKDGLEGFKEVVARKPHVIITDKVMPKFDGFSLFNSLSSIPETRAIPIILISGQMTAADEIKAFEMGFFDYIAKPVNHTTLITRVKRAFWFYDHRYNIF